MKKAVILAAVVLATFPRTAFAENFNEEIFRSIVGIHAVIPKDARSASSLGTVRNGHGVVIDEKGNILTVGYLVSEAERIEITLTGGKKTSATFVGHDQATGFGIVRADSPLGLPFLGLGDSSRLKEGEYVIVAGSGGPENAQIGRVALRREFAGYWEYLLPEAIYTVPVYADFGGAALINGDGLLVGIGSLFTQVYVKDVGVVGANVFIPVDALKPILGGLIAFGRSTAAQRPWLGVNSDESHGRVFITRVTKDGPAEKAGISVGDVVVSVLGKPVRGLSEFYKAVWDSGPPGVEVTIRVLRNDGFVDVRVKTGDRSEFSGRRPRKVL